MPVERQHQLLAGAAGIGLKAGAKPPVVGVEVVAADRAGRSPPAAVPRHAAGAQASAAQPTTARRSGGGRTGASSQPLERSRISCRSQLRGARRRQAAISWSLEQRRRSTRSQAAAIDSISAAGSNWRRRASRNDIALHPSTISRIASGRGVRALVRTATARGRRGSRTPTRPSGRSQTRTRGSRRARVRAAPAAHRSSCSAEALERVVAGSLGEMTAQQLDRRSRSARRPRSRRAGVEADELGVRRAARRRRSPPDPEHAPVVVAGELEQAGAVEVAQRLGFEVDRIGGDRAS